MLSTIKNELNKYDLYLLSFILLMIIFGSIMVISAGSFIAAEKFNNENYFITSQLKNVFLAVFAFCIAMTLNYRVYNNKYIMNTVLCLTVLALVYLLISNQGESIKGAKRWIFGFQPSEVAKNMIVFYFAYSINSKRQDVTKFIKGYIYHLAILSVVVVLVMLQPAFSTSMMIFVIGYSIFYIAGMKVKHLSSSMLVIIPLIIFMALFRSYRSDRISTFLSPSEDIAGAGWQVEQSLIGFGNGGMKGSGIGESRQKEFYLPEPHNDFIFSIIGDELGFAGTFILVGAYIFIMIRGFIIALKAKDHFGFLLASGITVTVIIYSVFNMFITLGLVPPTGLPLPLISYGGTSLIMTMFSLGVLLNISYKSSKGKATV
ncbi:MAG: putative peptidoglycan glycosyltransferase FtsW [Candidatus Delongbacteria bacterium]